ncbi:MAG: hypothetical protein IJB33_05605, partial [Akkermansia sp.]|nr:hypothetical protein [Akkermansia sp.]
GEALAETEKRCNTLIHRFLSPRFTGLKIIFHLLAGASGFGKPTPRRGACVARLPLPEFFRPLTGASVFGSPYGETPEFAY